MEQYSFQYHTIKLTISSTMLKIILFLLHIGFGKYSYLKFDLYFMNYLFFQ